MMSPTKSAEDLAYGMRVSFDWIALWHRQLAVQASLLRHLPRLLDQSRLQGNDVQNHSGPFNR